MDVLKQSSQTVSPDIQMSPPSTNPMVSMNAGGPPSVPNFFVPAAPSGPQAEPFDLMSHRADYEDYGGSAGAGGIHANSQQQPAN